MNLKGLILKGIGGFYYVETAQGIFECSARGKFRKKKISPYAGDHVHVETESDEIGVINEILERKNFLIRPPLANLDKLFIVVSLVTPLPNVFLIDKTIAAAEQREIEPILLITKQDLCEEDRQRDFLLKTYQQAGIPCFAVSAMTGEGFPEIQKRLRGAVSAFTGNSGVGKSTLLNALLPKLHLKTGETSEKLGRGRHTTREVELFPLENSGYVADTPGFSTFDIERYDMTDKEKLIYGFRDFMPYYGMCKFSSCTHVEETGCAIRKAVTDGDISASRYQSYLGMLKEIKDNKPWMGNNRSV